MGSVSPENPVLPGGENVAEIELILAIDRYRARIVERNAHIEHCEAEIVRSEAELESLGMHLNELRIGLHLLQGRS